LYFPEESP
jgi:hypothetical protein